MRPKLRPPAVQPPGPSSALERLAWSGRRWRDLNPREGCALNPLSRPAARPRGSTHESETRGIAVVPPLFERR